MKTKTSKPNKGGRPRTGRSPDIKITLPPLTMAEGKRQAAAAGMPFARWVGVLIERESVRPQP